MKYFLSDQVSLKWLEVPYVYHIKNDDLYELDIESLNFLKRCSESGCISEKDDFIDYCLKEGILDVKNANLRHPPLVKSPTPSLRYLELQITNRCNIRCKHCYINIPTLPSNSFITKEGYRGFKKEKKGYFDKNFSELSVKQIYNILKEFEYMQGLRVLITGGEPLIHSKFVEINEMLPEFSIRKVLFTNGVLLNKEKIKNLKVNEIQISIDGLKNAHDSLRGTGSFKKAMNAVRLALNHNFHVSIATMIHPGNIEDLDKMEKLFKKIGIKEWIVDIPCITGRLKENMDSQIKPEEGGKYLRYGYGSGIHLSSSGFACGLHLMAVTAEGKAAKCTFYSDTPVGEIKEGLRTCWERIKPVPLNELKCNCEYIESCRGGCRYRAQLLGDFFGKDFYRCALYGII